MDAGIGDGIEPIDELSIEVVEVAEAAAEKEVLADIAEWPLYLTLRFGPIGPAGARLKAVMPRVRRRCVFRGKPATDSGMKSATDSDLIAANPI
jgi:hypothetical protein